MKKIRRIKGREILDSRGNPTVAVDVYLKHGIVGRGIVPSGASTGVFEALELRDNDKKRYNGKGVLKAVQHVNDEISEILCDVDVTRQYRIDERMIKLDGTDSKKKLGANAILGTSLACADAAAKYYGMPLYQYIGGIAAMQLPVPMMNVINGGVHAGNHLDFQEFMIMPISAGSFREALRMGTEVYHALKEVLIQKGYSTAVGDEGGFAPDISDACEALELLTEGVKNAGYKAGEDIVFAMDAAASELYDEETEMYFFPGETAAMREKNDLTIKADQEDTTVVRTTDEMIAYYKKLTEQYPLISIEDGLDEDDWDGWKKLTEVFSEKIQLVGDDLFVTNEKRLAKGISEKCANSVLIKLNQIGSLSETIKTIQRAKAAGYSTVISHRSGETEDTMIADLAVALNCGQIKTGAPCRSERVAKYNRLLEIEEVLGDGGRYYGKNILRNHKN